MSSESKEHLALTDEDRAVTKAILLQWRAAGVENPVLPSVDFNNDGLVDGYGLDENDEVIEVLSVSLEETVYKSDGE